MTADLDAYRTPDTVDYIVAALASLMRSASERMTDDEFPFALVTLINGVDNPESGGSDDVIQVDYLDRARDGMEAIATASATARSGHRRILRLARHEVGITISDGSTVFADYLKVRQKPTPQPYGNDSVRRLVARYDVGLAFVTA